MATKKKLLQAAAGAAGGAGLNVEEVFSTYLYDGTGSAQTITNNIDLSGEGGLVWVKNRSFTVEHQLYDTERGVYKRLQSDTSNPEYSNSDTLTAFNSNGFSMGTSAFINRSGDNHTSWTFRKAPKFFDVVTYTGNGTAGRTVSHNLGATPGCIIVKRTDTTGNWHVYHIGIDVNGDSAPETDQIYLNLTNAASDGIGYWNDTAPTSTEFTVGSNSGVNASGGTYVAYLFAHNNGDGEFGPDADQDIIKCGSYTGNGSSQDIDLGFEAQWVMIKPTSTTGNWTMMDVMRGMPTSGLEAVRLQANTNAAEGTLNSSYGMRALQTGFTIDGLTANDYNKSGETYIYIAIRRGPMAVPESATDVFAIDEGDSSGPPEWNSGFPVDLAMYTNTNITFDKLLAPRLTSGSYLETNNTNAEMTSSIFSHDYMDGWGNATLGANYYSWMWKRAPNYFDVVAYTGTASSGNSFAPQNVSHNLDAVPEMMWVKCRSTGGSITYRWHVYHKDVGNTKALFLNETSTAGTGPAYWDNTTPTDSVFRVGGGYGVNQLDETYIAYLFASLDGVSKVGSYTGTGAAQNIDCGFSSGARFVLIKKTSGTGGWMVFDTERGIVASDDFRLELDDTGAESNTSDWIDPYSAGFSLPSTSTGNTSGASFIFYAIA